MSAGEPIARSGGTADNPETGAAAIPPARILVVDDERSMREFLTILLQRDGHTVIAAGDGRTAMGQLEQAAPDLVLSDIRLPDLTGVQVLERARQVSPGTPVILLTAYASTESAIQALKLGAFDYILKPFDVEELKHTVRRALKMRRLEDDNLHLRRELGEQTRFEDFVGASPPMQRVYELIRKAAPTDSTVLISGESGTGKELVARALHLHSPRRSARFVSLNCGAFPEGLLESELFGHVRGAFTGAFATKKGLFEIADGGTLLLDEIGEMSPSMQIKLLRVLQDRRIRRVGGTGEIPVDARIVASTNRDLTALVQSGGFREDLFYRINVIQITVPPLRERAEDIPLLVDHFIRRFGRMMNKPVRGVAPEVLAQLKDYPWPGNVRELENVIERGVALESGELLRTLFLQATPVLRGLPEEGMDLESHLDERRRLFMQSALERTGGVQKDAAKLLGMTSRSFRYYAKKFSLSSK
jgi:two-component system response regulator PilR (NtrC family)